MQSFNHANHRNQKVIIVNTSIFIDRLIGAVFLKSVAKHNPVKKILEK